MKKAQTAAGKFQRDLSICLAQHYKNAISENIKRGLAACKKNSRIQQSGSVKKSKV